MYNRGVYGGDWGFIGVGYISAQISTITSICNPTLLYITSPTSKMDKNRYLKIDHVSEINIIIETMQYYKHNNKNKPILDEDLDVLLSVCLELQKLFCK